MMKYTILPAILAAAVFSSANAFVTPTSFSQRSSSTTFLYAGSDTDDNVSTQHHLTSHFDTSFTRPLYTAVTSAFLATSLLFSNPLLPTPEVQAATAQQVVSPIATSVDIEIKNLPALTRKAIANRDALTNYIIDSAKSIKPILELLSESDTVTVIPPKDVKGAVNALLTKGDAQFNVNGQSVDVRVESVPGVVVVRVINPNIPRLPFLKDGTAALKFVDEIVDVAPAELEKVAEEAEAIEKFLTWGAPQKAPITYKGSSLDYFLSSKFLYNGEAVSLGGCLGDLTNAEVIFVGLGAGIVGAYGSSYAYYTSEKEKEEKEAAEKKAAVAAKKKAKAKAASAEKKDEKPDAAPSTPKPKKVEKPKEEPAEDKTQQAVAVQSEEKNETVAIKGKEKSSTTSGSDDDKPKGRKRDAIKNLFRRNKE